MLHLGTLVENNDYIANQALNNYGLFIAGLLYT